MAIVATQVTSTVGNSSFKAWDLTALDADTTLAIPHGLGAAPVQFAITSRLAASATDGVNQWSITTIDATNINVTKTTAAGSGGGVPGTTVVATLFAGRPHSIVG